jgi:XTP/dITP diphosphohydrolase
VEPRSLVLATTNLHKVREIAEILTPLGIRIEAADRPLPEVIEDGETFAANAYKKAASAAAFLGREALADDSGLVVEALGGEPGVHSARYAGPGAGAKGNNALLAARLEAKGIERPAAAFVCHAVIVAPDGTVVAEAEGRVEGEIRVPARGEEGFGYDPLFHHPPSDKRFAELTADEKNAVSHRARALLALADLYNRRF